MGSSSQSSCKCPSQFNSPAWLSHTHTYTHTHTHTYRDTHHIEHMHGTKKLARELHPSNSNDPCPDSVSLLAWRNHGNQQVFSWHPQCLLLSQQLMSKLAPIKTSLAAMGTEMAPGRKSFQNTHDKGSIILSSMEQNGRNGRNGHFDAVFWMGRIVNWATEKTGRGGGGEGLVI